MHVVVIGGTGHVGTYLVPRLINGGHQVTVVARGDKPYYSTDAAWQSARMVQMDRAAEEQAGTFGGKIADMEPDVVIDMICFDVPGCQQLVEALRGKIQHFLHCGTIWIHGHLTEVPVTEDAPREPFGSYGIQKSDIERYLMREARLNGFPATAVHPGHIMGPGWEVLTPMGNRNQQTIETIARGDAITLPNLGMETLHHVHADDVAQVFEAALNHWSVAVGESFHAVSPRAVTLRGYAEAVYRWFGHEPNISYLGWEAWQQHVPAEDADATWDHIAHSPSASIDKARRLLNYEPRYTSLQACFEAIQWQIDHGRIQVPA